MADEVVQLDVHVTDDVVQPNVIFADKMASTDPVPYVIANIEVTTLPTESSMHTD